MLYCRMECCHATTVKGSSYLVITVYRSKLGRDPSDKEVCNQLRISPKRLSLVKKFLKQFASLKSLDEPLPGEEDDSLTLGDSIQNSVDIETDTVNEIMEVKIKKELWEIVRDNTTDQESTALTFRYKQNMTLRDIGKEMNVSFERVRQLEQKGLKKLRLPRITRDIQERFEVNYAKAYRGSLSSFKYDWTSSTERVALKNLEIEGMI